MIRDRTAAGLTAARARRRRGGRPNEKIRYALALNEARELKISEMTAKPVLASRNCIKS